MLEKGKAGSVAAGRILGGPLPVEALLGEPLTPAAQASHLGAFYHHFDLSNEQAFTR
jgi:hypothetical protein